MKTVHSTNLDEKKSSNLGANGGLVRVTDSRSKGLGVQFPMFWRCEEMWANFSFYGTLAHASVVGTYM